MPAKIPKPTIPTNLDLRKSGIFRFGKKLIKNKEQLSDTHKTQIQVPTPQKQSNDVQKYLKDYLLAVAKTGCSSSTIRNYKSDINQFLDFADSKDLNDLRNKPKLLAFAHYQREKGLKENSVKRKLVSITQFKIWLKQQGLINSEIPLISIESVEQNNTINTKNDTVARKIIGQGSENLPKEPPIGKVILDQKEPKKTKKPQNRLFILLNVLSLLLFLGGLAYFAYQQFGQAIISLAYPSTPTAPNRILSYQGRLTNTDQTPISNPTAMTYTLYDADTGGSILWSSNTCTVDPDQDGIFNANLGAGTGTGSDAENCGGSIGENVFTENNNVWLEVAIGAEILAPRQPIRTVAYALNAATLQGLPPAEVATNSTILMMNSAGEVVLGTDNPVIKTATTSSGITIEANRITMQTMAGSNGDIVLNPDGDGILDIQSDASVSGSTTLIGNTHISSANTLIFGGTTALGEISSPTDSGAYLIGVNDQFTNSNKTNVQGVLADFDSAIGIAGNPAWSNLIDPAADLALNHGTFTTAFNWDTGTGTDDLFSLTTDASSNGTGSLLNVQTGAGSTVSPLRVRAGNTEALFVDNAGKVGIGTTSPASKLHISDATSARLRIQNTGTGQASLDLMNADTTATNFRLIADNGEFRMYDETDAVDRLKIDTAGNVGVGTTSPAYLLDVNGSFRVQNNALAINSSGYSTTPSTNTPWQVFANSNPQNIIPNGDLESWTAGTSTYPDGFRNWSAASTVTRESATANVHQGNYSAKIVSPSSGAYFTGIGYFGPRIDKNPNDTSTGTYTVSFWYKQPSTNTQTSAFGVYDTAGASYVVSDSLTKDDAWHFYSKTFSIRYDSDWYIRWATGTGTATAGDTLYIDAISFTKGNEIYQSVQSPLATTGNVTRWGDFYNMGGNVGVGTITPSQKLDVSGNIKFSGALMPNNAAGTSGQFLISGGAGVAPTWTSTIAATSIPFSGITSGTNTSAAMIVGAGASLNYTSTGTINASSLLGGTWANPGTIGFTTPNTGAFTTLSSTGNTTFGNADVDTVTSNAATWTFANDTNFTLTGGTNGLSFDTNTLSIDATNDRVGIGSTTPAHKLDVNGNLGLVAGGYINWGNIDGSTGYGIRDNTGTIEFKNSAGEWAKLGTGDSLWINNGTNISPANLTQDVFVGGTSTASATIALKADGSSRFNGDMVVGPMESDGFSGITSNIFTGREAGDYGAGKTGIYSYRAGNTNTENGGTSWSYDGIDTAILGYSEYGDNYSAGVAGFSWLDYANSASVLGGSEDGSLWGALGFNDGNSLWAGYFNGNGNKTAAFMNGNVGIGTTNPSKKLVVEGDTKVYYTNSGTSSTNIFDSIYTQSVDAPSATIYGSYNKADFTSTGTMYEMGAAKYDTYNSSSGTVNRMFGLDSNTINASSGTVSLMTAIHGRGYQFSGSAGTISTLHTFFAENAYKGPEGTIANLTGMTIDNMTSGNNNTNLLLGTTAVPSGNYSIYSASNYSSYFAGNMGIGTTTPIFQTEIFGGGQLTANLTDAGNRTGMLAINGNSTTAGAGGAIVFGNSSSHTANSLGFAAIKGLLTDSTANTIGALAFSTRATTGATALTERMRITAGGFVGIGTDNPNEMLMVNGSINAEKYYDLTNKNYYLDPASVGTSLKIAGSAEIEGNVGLGTASSTYKLSIGGATSTIANTTGDITINAASNNISFAGDNLINVGNGNFVNGYFSGSVGIGTTAPGTKLQINNEAAFNTTTPGLGSYGLHFSGQTTADYANGITWNGGTGTNAAQAGIYVQGSGAYGTKMYFATTDAYVTGSKTRMMIDHVGNVGIGMTPASSYKLDVAGNIRSSGEIISTSANAFRMVQGNYGSFLRNDGGYTYLLLTASGDPYGGWNTLRPITVNNSTGYVSFGNGHGDLAENYRVSGKVLRGTIVSIGSTNPSTAISSSATYSSILGVISTDPGAIMDVDGGFQVGAKTKTEYNDEKAPIALTGAVPALVTSQNGSINIGDAIGISSISGYGAKMTSAGQIVGKALEKFDTNACFTISSVEDIVWPEDNGKNSLKPCYLLPDGTYVGKVMIAVAPSWYDPSAYLHIADLTLDANGDVVITGSNEETYAIATSTNTIDRIAAFADVFTARLQAGFIKTKELVADVISATNATIANLTASNLETDTITSSDGQIDIVSNATISGDLAVTANLDIAGDANVNSNLTVTGESKLGQLIADTATISEATIAGTLSAGEVRTDELEANSARINAIETQLAQIENATVSGTLYAENIEANSISANVISGLKERLSEQIAETLTQPTLLATLFEQQSAQTDEYLNQLSQEINDNATASATTDATLEDLNTNISDSTLIADNAFINEYFEVNGNAFIANSLKIGQSLLIGENTVYGTDYISYQPIGTEDFTFHIQPAGIGRLSLMAGLMELDQQGFVTINGNLKVAGVLEVEDNLKVKGTLLTNMISAETPGESIQVQLASVQEGTDSATIAKSNFEFVDETRTPVATVSAGGDLSLTGSLRINNPATATEASSITNSSSAGQATLEAGATEITIASDKVEENSMIYVTPLNSTNNQVLYVKNKITDSSFTPENDGQFTVAIDYALGNNVVFNWWIVQLQ